VLEGGAERRRARARRHDSALRLDICPLWIQAQPDVFGLRTGGGHAAGLCGGEGEQCVERSVSRSELQCGRLAAPAKPEECQVLVGCGRSLVGARVAIVEPETCRRLATDRIGEVWVSGPNIACGYWQNPDATMSTFRACIEGEAEGPWLRTGDLGFLDRSGELFIAGRLKEVIIIRGMNHYPQDIENSVQNAHPALRRNCGAAFAALDQDQEEILIVIQEVERAYRNQIAIEELVAIIREAVINGHEINRREILLLRPGGLPVTTSGKVQRILARTLWQSGALDLLD
jgi:acyl-CoA synthetase (AMP-forming)/AMP-acid ligase II